MKDNNLLLKGGAEIFDGFMTLKLSKDRMKAFILPKDDIEGSTINFERLKTELHGLGVVFGILEKSEPVKQGVFCVAKGIAVQHGEDARVKMHVKPSVVRVPKKKDPDKDEVDFRELGSIVNVTKDRLLVEKIPPTKGTPGKDVLGREMQPKPGKDRKLKGGAGVYLSDDERRVYAQIDGKFLMADGKPAVYSEHTVSGDIDLSVGNITFGGSDLTISGEVLPGFTVKCRGNISIARGVNNAIVMAGGNIAIRGGVIGEEAAVRAKGDVLVDFVESGPMVESGNDLMVSDFIVQGRAKVAKKMSVTSGKGTVIGGKYVVGGSLYVKELGSDAEIVTDVSVGVVPSLQAKKQKIDEELALWNERMNEILKNISALEALKKEQGGDFPPEKEELLKKYRTAMPKAMDKVNDFTEMNNVLEEELGQMVAECVYVYGKLFPGVTVRIGSVVRVISAEEEQVVIYFDKTSRQIFVRKMSREERSTFE